MSIILARLPQAEWSYGTSLARVIHCRLDPSSTQHGAYVDDQGVFHYQHIDADARTTTTLLRFQLQYSATEGAPYEPISKPWCFEFIPGMPGDLLLVQEHSCRILYASLPKQAADSNGVYLFGSHTAPVSSFCTNGNIVLSGCQSGVLKLWRLSDGQLADTCTTPDKASVTALACLGPLVVAAGTSSSTVTLYDVATGCLLAVQRLMAGPGTVKCMAAWLPQELLAAANLAPAGPLPPDGGGMLSSTAGEEGASSRPLLAVASSSGWLCVYATSQPGSGSSGSSWAMVHSTGSLIAPGSQPLLAFSPDGASLAVGSLTAQVLSTDAVAVAAAGGQPGTISLYQVAAAAPASSSSSGAGGAALSALLPPLLLEQRPGGAQLPELRLWHQWSLSSAPAGLLVLPGSSGLRLLEGVQLRPSQAVSLLVVPEVGPGQILHAQRHLPSPPKRQAPAGAAGVYAGASRDHQQLQRAAAGGGSGSSAESSQRSSSKGGSLCTEDEALLLNIAERDLAEVAQAIAAAAWPLHDAELSALLASVTLGLPAAPPAAAAAADTAGAAMQGDAHPAGTAADVAGAAAGASAAAAAEAVSGAAAMALCMPRTLPNKRSWLDPRDASAAGRAAAGRTELRVLAQQLQLEQERLKQQQQQQEGSIEESVGQAGLFSDAAPAAAAGQPSDIAAAGGEGGARGEQELPSESSLQHMPLPGRAGSSASSSTLRAGAQSNMDAQQQQQQQEEEESSAPAAAAAAAPAASASADGASVFGRAGVLPTLMSPGGQEPQPRQLPSVLRQQRPAAIAAAAPSVPHDSVPQLSTFQPPAPAPAAGFATISSSGSGRGGDRGTAHGTGDSSSRGVAPAVRLGLGEPSDEPGPRSAGPPQAMQRGPVATAAAGGPAQLGRQQLQQPMLPQREQQQQRQQQQPRRLTVQERLSQRRQELLVRRQLRGTPDQAPAAAGLKDVAAADAACGWGAADAAVPARDHPLAAAVQNSSRLLAAKLQEMEKAPDVAVDPLGPAAAKLALARMSELDLAPDQQQYDYGEMPGLRDIPTPIQALRLVPKQLDPHWVASRSLKPSMDTLFDPRQWQQGFLDPQLLVLPSWPTPQQVVQQLLWPGQRPGAWS